MLFCFEILGFLFIGSCALLFHYVDEVFKPNKFTDLFSINNDSVWENLKVIVLPIIFWSFIELPYLKNNDNILIAKLLQIFVSIALLFIIYYSSQVLLKRKTPLLKGIAIYVSALISSLVSYMILSINTIFEVPLLITIGVFGFIIVVYCLLTTYPPKINFFRDPNTQVYGKN